MHIFFVGKFEGKSQLVRTKRRREDEFHWVFRKKGGNVWTEFMFTRIRTSIEPCQYGNIGLVSLQDGHTPNTAS